MTVRIPTPMLDTASPYVRPGADTDLRTAPGRRREEGVALVMALIFSILLYILVAELVVSSRMVRQTGENDALLARMRTQMTYQLGEAEDQLLADLAGSETGGLGGEAGGLGALGAAAGAAPGEGAGEGGGLGGGEGEGEQEEDPTANCDSSRDAWFAPIGHPDNDMTTYVWIEDENRKFNLLTIWSPDEEYAQASREGLQRLIDVLREDTEFDVSSADAAMIVQRIVDWGRRPSTLQMPTPLLKSLDENDRDFYIPLHLDELMMIEGITEDLFFDKALDERYFPGLESVLTIWTSLRPDPGDPEKLARQRAIAEARGERVPPPSGEGAGEQGQGAGESGSNEQEGPQQPEGLGVKVNVNTASWPVLRAVLPAERVPDRVIDAIIQYRNEIDEEATEAAQEETQADVADFGDMQLGDEELRKFFETVADLEQVEEFAQLDDEIKTDVQTLLTTKSEVFSIHVATLYKRSNNEANRVYLLLRARSIVLRIDDGEEGKILPLVPFEERVGLRLQPVDLQEDYYYDPSRRYMEMDQFAAEERAWNPFLLDFYLPQESREMFFR